VGKFEAFLGLRLPKEIVELLKRVGIQPSDFVRDAIYDRILKFATSDESLLQYLESLYSSKVEELKRRAEKLSIQERQLELELERVKLDLEKVRNEKSSVEEEIKSFERRLKEISTAKEEFRKFREELEAKVKEKFDNVIPKLREMDREMLEEVARIRASVVAKELGVSEGLVWEILAKLYPDLFGGDAT